MQQLLQFLSEQWLYVAGFIIVLVLLLINELHGAKKSAKKCTSAMVTQLLNKENAQLIDVRDKADFKAGHITGSQNISIADITDNAVKLEKDRPIVVICKLGQRAQSAAMLLKKQGYSNVMVLAGGLTAWRNDGLPVVKK